MAEKKQKVKKVLVVCPRCKLSFEKYPSEVKDKNYCCKECFFMDRYGKYSGGRVETACFTCGKVIKKYPRQIADKNFCSIACTAKSREVECVNVVCQQCGKSFDVPPSRAGAKFCSSDCFNESIRGVPKNAGYVSRVMAEQRMKRRCENLRENIFVCKNCNKAYIRWRRVGDEGKEYCSRECFFDKVAKDKGKKEQPLPVSKKRSLVYFCNCIVCGCAFTAKIKGKKICSDKCAYERFREYQKQRYEPKPPKYIMVCEHCGRKKKAHRKNQKFCSRKCCSAHQFRIREPKKKAERLGVYYEPVNPLKVFIRDGWRCQQCNKKLNPKNRGKMIDAAPELDHILPWAQGGEHSYRNTQLLCRKCNGKKNSQPIGQMLMFGELEVRREYAVS